MTEILSLKSEDKQRLNSCALKRFNDWQAEILSKVPQLRQLSLEQVENELITHLAENEIAEFNKCLADIRGWLSRCMDIGEGNFESAYDTRVIGPMLRVKSLVITAYQRVAAERQKKEYDDRWCAAFISIKPPVDDAKKYLNSKEHDYFILAMGKAIDLYLKKGSAYLDDVRAFDYCWWLHTIQERKRKEAQKVQAVDEASKYSRRLNQEIRKLASQLVSERPNLVDYFRANTQDKRYKDYTFDYVLSEEHERKLDTSLVSVANKRLGQLLSNDLRYFVSLPSKYYRIYFPLPVATYRLEKVPCIDIGFDIFAAAYAEVWLTPRIREFNGHEFELPEIEETNDLVRLEKARFLAYHHLILTSEDLSGYILWKSIPLILLRGLLHGETRPDGCTLSAASDSVTTYRIEGLKAEVEIPDEFVEYLKSIGSIDEMIDTGIISEKVGNIVRAALSEMEAKHEILPAKEKTGKGNSAKERAFRSFDNGKRPSDPELKALDIKAQSIYRYYQEWKKTSNRRQF